MEKVPKKEEIEILKIKNGEVETNKILKDEMTKKTLNNEGIKNLKKEEQTTQKKIEEAKIMKKEEINVPHKDKKESSTNEELAKPQKVLDKPQTDGQQGQLTPYQGKRRSYGWFNCTTCNSKWTSACCWANTYQQCLRCLKHVYPFRMAALQRGLGRKDKTKSHQSDLCGMCKKLGRNCMNRV